MTKHYITLYYIILLYVTNMIIYKGGGTYKRVGGRNVVTSTATADRVRGGSNKITPLHPLDESWADACNTEIIQDFRQFPRYRASPVSTMKLILVLIIGISRFDTLTCAFRLEESCAKLSFFRVKTTQWHNLNTPFHLIVHLWPMLN